MAVGRRVLIALVLVVGLIALAVGVIYLVEPSHALPSFFPGHTTKGRAIMHKHGYAAVVVGVVLVVGAAVAFVRDRRYSGDGEYGGF